MKTGVWAKLLVSLAMAVTLTATPGFGQEKSVEERLRDLERQVELLMQQFEDADSTAIARMRLQIDAITRDIEELKLGQEVVVQADTGAYGLGPAASKVYRVQQGVSIGGYGEFLFTGFSDNREDGLASDKDNVFDALRGVVYIGYKFSDRFLFNSEIEVEHASTSNSGSVSLEFAYVDWLFSNPLGGRAGLLLLPMGFLNELHEPPTFLGSMRPETERAIIPSTWRENGLGVFGGAGGFGYRAYVVNGLDATGESGVAGFTAAGLRGGRQKGSKALANDFAGVARVDYMGVLGLLVGTSFYVGNSGQGALTTDSTSRIGALTMIWDGHAQYRARGLWLRGLFALSAIDNVPAINDVQGFTGDQSVGERLVGWYLEGGYDVLHGLRTQHQLLPYVRYEQIDTQDKVPQGFSRSGVTDRRILTIGAAWLPIPNLIAKADYQIHKNAADTGVNQFDLYLGYMF
jgi:hypothetical protein